jgi:hypothetical protein
MNENNSHIENEDLNFLNGISKKNNFKTPAGYFEELASNLETKLEVKNAKSPKRGIVRNIIVNLSIAAAVIIGVFIFKPSTNQLKLPEFLGEEVTIDEFMESMLESDFPEIDYVADISPVQSVENEVEALLADVEIKYDEFSSGELLDMFESDWEKIDYEF